MTNTLVSPIEKINAALERQNPFAVPPYVGSQEVWGHEFPDIKSLNAHVSNTVIRAINEIRTGLYPRTSIAVTAESGTGKTHVISRIRHHLQAEGGTFFIYATQFSELDNIKKGFLATLGNSLGQIGSKSVTQWQELATDIANQAVRFVQPQAKQLLPQDLIAKLSRNQLIQSRNIICKLTSAFQKTKPNLKNPDIIKAILWTLIEGESLYAIKWLSGEELAQYKSNELYLPTSIGQSFDAIQQILDLISDYNQLLICFDELDSTEYSKTGFTKAQVIAGLVKELFENISKGVILSVMMPATWSNKIKQLPAGVYSKMSAQGNPLDLNYMTADSILELVSLWLSEYYQRQNLIPHQSLYPFTENQLRDLTSEDKPPVRRVLKWCQENCKPTNFKGIITPIINVNPVEEAFKKEISENIDAYLDDNYCIADALFFGFQTILGQTVENVLIEQINEKVKSAKSKDKHINFKIVGKEQGKEVNIGVAVLQNPSGHALGAGLRKLEKFDSLNLTRASLVRSKSKYKKISRHLERTYVEPFISKGGEFVELKIDGIKSLIAIRSVHKKREVDYGLTEQQILSFVHDQGAEYLLGTNNPLLKEILSAPSYQVPDDVVGEDIEILESTNPELSDSEDFSLLSSDF